LYSAVVLVYRRRNYSQYLAPGNYRRLNLPDRNLSVAYSVASSGKENSLVIQIVLRNGRDRNGILDCPSYNTDNSKLIIAKTGRESINMGENDKIAGYLAIVLERLRNDDFNIADRTIYKNQTFDCVARRTGYQAEYHAFTDIFFIFASFTELDKPALRQYSAKCFDYAMRSKAVPFWPGVVLCFPIAIVGKVDGSAVEDIRSKFHPMHLGAFEMPVICDISSSRLYYLETTPFWGRLYRDHHREIIVSMLSP